MEVSAEKHTATLWSRLQRELEEAEYRIALNTINELRGLKKCSASDIQVLLASRFLALLALGEYEQALCQFAALTQVSVTRGSDETCASKETVEKLFGFEKIYCLYKANKCGVGLYELERLFPSQEGDNTGVSAPPKFVPLRLTPPPSPSSQAKHSASAVAVELLRGLLLYRIGYCALAKKYFSEILSRSSLLDETATFLTVNIAACDACGSRISRGFRRPDPSESEKLDMQGSDCYPLTFNVATAKIQQGLPTAALQLLKLARDQWIGLAEKLRSTNSNDSTFDENDIKLIDLQIAVAKQQTRGRRLEAESDYKSHVELRGNPPKPSCTNFAADDLAVSTVVLNNLAIIWNQPAIIPPLLGAPTWLKVNCLNSCLTDRNWECPSLRERCWQKLKTPPPLTLKHFSSGYTQSPSFRLSRPQIESVIRNRAVALLRGKKFEDCRVYLKDMGFCGRRVCAATAELAASALLGDKQYKTAAEELFFSGMNLLQQGSSEGMRLLLLATTAALFAKHFQLGSAILEQLPSTVVIQLGSDALIRAYYRAFFALAPAVASKDLGSHAKSLMAYYNSPTGNTKENSIVHPWSFIDPSSKYGQSVFWVLGNVFFKYHRFEAAKRCFELSSTKSPLGTALHFYAETCAIATNLGTADPARFPADLGDLGNAAIMEHLKSPAMNQIDPDDVESMVIRITKQEANHITKLSKVLKSTQCLNVIASQLYNDITNRMVFPTSQPRGVDGVGRKVARRRHKIRYPKGYDPNNSIATPLPDPDRWLSKKQKLAKIKSSTSTKKTAAKAMRAAQGALTAPGSAGGRRGGVKRQGK